jgi:hypothetical protein
MPQFLVPSISKASVISVASYDFVDKLLGKTLTKQISASNVATLKLDRAHGKEIGDHVYINGLSTHLEYNGYFVINAIPTPESFSYALTHAADAENADTGGVIHDPNSGKQDGFYLRVGGTGNVRYQLPGNVTAQGARRVVVTNVVTVHTRRPHGLLVGNTIVMYGWGLAGLNNTGFTVATVPTPTTFTIPLTTGDADVIDGGGIIFDTIVKSFTAVTKFDDPELIKIIFTLGTAATGLVVGYSKDQRG